MVVSHPTNSPEVLMTTLPAMATRTLSLFAPPYEHFHPCTHDTIDRLRDVELWKGNALVWQLTGQSHQAAEFELLRRRAPGIPLMVLLPPPHDIRHVLDMLPLVRTLAPRMILPHGIIDTPYRLRQVFTLPPRSISAAVADYLVRRGILASRKTIREFQRIVDLAPETQTISALSRRMYTSRRTIGRHFIACGLPVPSHCLHFARLLHVAMHLQNEDTAMFRIAGKYGYPDGFTMSNQMKRLIGYRPTEVRQLLGWEWIVEAWLKKERR
jgi:AraC-like DNA-binding protein